MVFPKSNKTEKIRMGRIKAVRALRVVCFLRPSRRDFWREREREMAVSLLCYFPFIILFFFFLLLFLPFYLICSD